MKKRTVILRVWAAATVAMTMSVNAGAMELDWGGQFWSEFNWVSKYNMNSADSKSARWESLFFRLKPRLVVNDNIYIKSELWAGDPIFGTFGSAPALTSGSNSWYSSQSRGSFLTAQRFWGEFISDFGTIQLGRAPLHWGLGLMWNSGDGLFNRYQSTGDTFRLISKFGAFSVIPSFSLYSGGRTISDSCNAFDATGACTPGGAGGLAGSVADYSLALKYENADEDFEAGVNLIKRLAGQDQSSHVLPGGAGGSVAGIAGGKLNYNTWDIYGRKKIGAFTLAAEVPIASGNIGAANYSAFAIATELGWRASDVWESNLRFGMAPGQPNDSPNEFKAFYFHPNYNLGMVMFNLQLQNFSGQNITSTAGSEPVQNGALRSPYDNPITNATYVGWSLMAHVDKWDFSGGFMWAKANEACGGAGTSCFNHFTRQYDAAAAAGVAAQSTSIGWEMDYGATFNWDDYFKLKLDMGFFFPGDYFAYSGTTTPNPTDMVFATSARFGVSF